MIDEQKLRELATRVSQLANLEANELAQVMDDSAAAILALLDELQSLRSERTAWRVNAENAEAQVEADRVSRDVPAGWKLVPVEATAEMLAACKEVEPVRNFPPGTTLAEADAINNAKFFKAMLAASPQQQPVQAQPNLLSWAVDRWLAEVSNRPLVNIHRRTLDDTWRQVIRFAGGDPDELIGPSHGALLSAEQAQKEE